MMSEAKWEETREGGQIVYTWHEFNIRRVQTSASYTAPNDRNQKTFAWEATKDGELLFRHPNLETVKDHCEAL